jgi:hypothetical protein
MPAKKIPLAERFEAKFNKLEGQCWLWLASRNKFGYGMFKTDGRKIARAHRVAYELANGPIPKGLSVCHSCDNRNCVNPAHLFLGTHADNMRDCANKGRFGRSALTPELVSEIRGLLSSGARQAEIVRRYGLSRSAVCRIAAGTVWRGATG